MNRPRDRVSSSGLLPRMEARPLKGGGFTFRYHPPGGKPIALGRDKEAALRKVLDLSGAARDDGTFDQMWRLYTTSPAWQQLASGTHVDYQQSWKQLAKVFARAHVSALRPADVYRYLRIEREGKSRANKEVAVLSNLCTVAVERGLIDANPCQGIKYNRERPRTRLVEQHELDAFVSWALQQGASAVVLVSMAQFAALAGNRRSEFLKLHWPQVSEGAVRMLRAKQGHQIKREEVAISQALQEVLDRMRSLPRFNPLGPVFASPKSGNAYTENGFKTMWDRLKNKALRERIIAQTFTFHDLRAHYTTYYKRQFGALPELHANPATTGRVYDRTRTVSRKAL